MLVVSSHLHLFLFSLLIFPGLADLVSSAQVPLDGLLSVSFLFRLGLTLTLSPCSVVVIETGTHVSQAAFKPTVF